MGLLSNEIKSADFFNRTPNVLYWCCLFNNFLWDFFVNRSIVKINQNIEKRLLLEINRYREAKGLNILITEGRIADIARRHSMDMATGLTPVGHVNADQRFETISQTGLSWIAVAENVACVKDPVADSLQCWSTIRGYKKNMEGDFDLTGIGIVQNRNNGSYYITQIFVKIK